MMKKKSEIEQDIVTITMKINRDFPELSKYINEMPIKASKTVDNEMDVKSLLDYCRSLQYLISEYAKTHTTATIEQHTANTALEV